MPVGEKATDPDPFYILSSARGASGYFAGPHRLSIAFIISKYRP
jgi:hypothetical protein